MDTNEIRLVDYSSSSDSEEFCYENINDGNLDNFEEDNIKERLQHKAMDLSKVAVVQPLLKHGTVHKNNHEGTLLDNQFGQTLEDNLENNQQQIEENLDQGVDFNLEQMFENAPPPSSAVNNQVPLFTPDNFLEAFQSFINVRENAESSPISEQSLEDQDSSLVCVSSEESEKTQIYSPPPTPTSMSPTISDNDPIVIDDSLSDTTGM